MKTEITFLIDNKPGEGLAAEHGLSMFIKAGATSFIFDTGQSSGFAANAEKLGINLADADFGVLSHGHYDHGNGMPYFFETNTEAPFYLHKDCSMPIYYSTSRSPARFIGVKPEIFNDYPERFRFISDTSIPAEGVHIFPCTQIADRHPIFNDNSLFLRDDDGDRNETFDHEIYIAIERDQDLIIISGCSHNNITAIIKHAASLFPGKKINRVIGGFHMPDAEKAYPGHDEAISRTGEELKAIAESDYVSYSDNPLFLTGHCTGDRAKLMLTEILGRNIDFFHTGSRFLL